MILTDEQVIAELRVSDLDRLKMFRGVIDEQIGARLSPEGVRSEIGAMEIDAQVDLDAKFPNR